MKKLLHLCKTTTGGAILLVASAVIGIAGCTPPTEEPALIGDGGKSEITLSDAERAASESIAVKPGEAMTFATQHPMSNGNEQGIRAQALSVQGMTWTPLTAGGSRTVSFNIDAGETVAVHMVPFQWAGDLDISLFQATTSVGSSSRGAGYVDSIIYTTSPYASPATLTLKMYCYAGTCTYSTVIGKGNKDAFATGAVYVNQRRWATITNRCTNTKGTYIADGECMCAPSSAAMGLVTAGKARVEDLQTSAWDLFTNTNTAGGAADRVKLQARLKSNYGYGTCQEETVLGSEYDFLKNHVLQGHLVLLRSGAFSAPGHYVAIKGFSTLNGYAQVWANDPYGAWVSSGSWNPSNSTAEGSTNGQDRWYTWSTVAGANSGASVISCW